MLKPALTTLALLCFPALAQADTSGGSNGIAFAALMAQHTPTLSVANK